MVDSTLRSQIIDLIKTRPEEPLAFVAGVTPVPVSGKVLGNNELVYMTEAVLDGWLTAGRFSDAFEKEFAHKIGAKYAFAVNSGSSANLLVIAALCSPLLKERQLKAGDEVITVAAGFPTTVAPLVQHGLLPVFVDTTPPTYNAVSEQVEAAVTSKTRAIFMAHTLGNPFDIENVLAVARKHNLFVVEDACDALGSTYTIDGETKLCGSFGHMASFSFYPAHHITMGEGGAVVTSDATLRKALLSIRDWGRDCWCPTGHDDSCNHRYEWSFPKLPKGYDHKYVYSHLGYNLKITDMQAALGLAQLERLDGFTVRRRENFARLHNALLPFNGEKLLLPEETQRATTSWFGFPITFDAKISRQEFLQYLNAKKIGTRLLFAGNITCQPCFEGVAYRAPFGLQGTDTIMNHTAWLGVFPGLTTEHIDYAAEIVTEYLNKV